MEPIVNRLAKLVRYDTLAGRTVRLPLRLIPAQMVLPIVHGKLWGYRWIVGSSNHGCWLGTYEYAKQQKFIQLVREGMIVYDIGAHVGFYTLLASVLVGAEGSVTAFEPLPVNLELLYKHLEINQVQNVTVVEAALSDSTKLATFLRTPSPSMSKLDDMGDLKVKTFRLDDVVLQENLPLPDVIKIDIEGEEARALRGAQDVLTRATPRILLATHGDQVREECRLVLDSLGYTMTPLPGDTTGSEFLAQRSD